MKLDINKKFPECKGAYFSRSPQKFIRPAKIGDEEIYVETNRSANLIRNVIVKLLPKFSYNPNNFKIYFRVDYSSKGD